MIDQARLKKQLTQISKFGALSGGGMTRLAFSKEEKSAREYLKDILNQMGAKIKEDGIGNIFAKFEGEDKSLPSVTSGSHLDSVPYGGFYDGTLGIMCALEAIKSIQESKQTFKRSLELIIFSCEESSRFNMATVGSKVVSGKLDLKKLHDLKDKDGISIYKAAKDFGCDVDNLEKSVLKKDKFYSYIELHIEQGPVLENRKIPIGIVLAIASPIRYKLDIIGRADHSGATPMNMRKDALVCASEIILQIEKIASKQKTTVATVGYANATPGVLNVIPGLVSLGIDIRDIDKEALVKCDKKIVKSIKNITSKREIEFKLTQLSKDFPTILDQKIIDTIEQEAKKLNIKTLKLPSGAGHDAMHLTDIATHTGMMFIPCKDGISHNIKERIDLKDAYKATKILKKSFLKLANEEQ